MVYRRGRNSRALFVFFPQHFNLSWPTVTQCGATPIPRSLGSGPEHFKVNDNRLTAPQVPSGPPKSFYTCTPTSVRSVASATPMSSRPPSTATGGRAGARALGAPSSPTHRAGPTACSPRPSSLCPPWAWPPAPTAAPSPQPPRSRKVRAAWGLGPDLDSASAWRCVPGRGLPFPLPG